MTLLDPGVPNNERPLGTALVALLLAAFAVIASCYGICVATAVVPFNSGAWVVGEEVAMRGWVGYILAGFAHLLAAAGLWRRWRWARWFAVVLLAAGLLPSVPGVSAAVVDLRLFGIAFWGVLIILRAAAIYALMNAE